MAAVEIPRDSGTRDRWERPTLTPLTGSANAATGSSTYVAETSVTNTAYVPLPS